MHELRSAVDSTMAVSLPAGEFRVYGARWHMLVLYASSSLLNAVLWISFASIDDDVATFYDVSVSAVNWLAIVFQVMYFPAMLFALYLLAAFDLRFTLVVGTGMGAAAGVLRAVSALVAPSAPHLGYAVCMAGQLTASMAQPIFLSTPAKVAANWFPVSERDLATTIGSLFNPLGNAMGQVVPPMVVVSTDDDGDNDDMAAIRRGMQRLLWGQAAVLTLSWLWTLAVFRSYPPTPPSQSTQDRLKALGGSNGRKGAAGLSSSVDKGFGDGGGGVGGNGSNGSNPLLARADGAADNHHHRDHDDDHHHHREDGLVGAAAAAAGEGGAGDVIRGLLHDFRRLLWDRNFLLLLVSFSVGLAVFNAMLTVINQWLSPYGFSNDQAGLAGGMLILLGLLGAASTAVLLDMYHAYRAVLKGAFVCAFCALAFLCLVLQQSSDGGGPFGGYTMLLVAFGAMGFFTLPILPGVIENAVEATYPVPEEASSGLLFCSGNVVGILFTIVLAKLVKRDAGDDDAPYWTPATTFLLVAVAVAVALVLPYQGEYKRLAAEDASAGPDEEQAAVGGGGARSSSSSSGAGGQQGSGAPVAAAPLQEHLLSGHERE